jgi:hypothetical protein
VSFLGCLAGMDIIAGARAESSPGTTLEIERGRPQFAAQGGRIAPRPTGENL